MSTKKIIQAALTALILLASLVPVSGALAGSAVCGGNFTVARGDTLRSIAERCGTTVAALQLANNLSNVNLIYPGQVLLMPGVVIHGSNGYDIYIVARGDTLKSVAELFGTNMETLLSLNRNITNINLIYEGQRMIVPLPGGSVPPPPPPPGGQAYTIQKGETLRILAARFNTSVEAILQANPQIWDPNRIYAGQQITLPAGISTYIVQRGDTLKSIAARFGTTWENLAALNPAITNANLIYPGQVIRLW